MPLIPFPVEQFGGLDVTSDPTDIGAGGAINATNVTFQPPGGFRTRPGLTTFTAFNQTTPASNPFQHLWEAHDGKVIAQAGSTLYAIDTAGASSATGAFTTSGSYANFAGRVEHTSGVTFAARSGGSVPVQWNSTAFSVPGYGAATQPTGDGIAFTSRTARLANWGVSGNLFRVLFSNAGDPYGFPAENFVDLYTSDFTGLRGRFGCSWGGDLHLLTQRYVHVFPAQGEGTLSDGTPTFNFNSYETPFADAYVSHMVPAVDGVYVMSTKGLYRFAHGNFTLVSDGVSPLVRGDTTLATTLGGAPSLFLCGDSDVHRARAVNDQIYFPASTTATSGPPDYMLVWDLRRQGWLIWSTAYTGLGFATNQRHPRLLVSLRTGTSPNPITYLDPAATTDNGTAISWAYQTGYSSAGGYFRQRIVSSGERKKHFRTDILGSGTVTHQVLALNARANDVADPGGTVTLGTSPAIARGSRRRGVRGTYFAHKLSGTGPATINGLTYWLSEIGQDT